MRKSGWNPARMSAAVQLDVDSLDVGRLHDGLHVRGVVGRPRLPLREDPRGSRVALFDTVMRMRTSAARSLASAGASRRAGPPAGARAAENTARGLAAAQLRKPLELLGREQEADEERQEVSENSPAGGQGHGRGLKA